jgi:Cas7 group CRISPR-associated protein Csh2
LESFPEAREILRTHAGLMSEVRDKGQMPNVQRLAHQTGVSTQDLARFWEAFQKCWEIDRSASRGDLSLRGLHIFSHEHPLGNAPAHKLFECIALEQDGATPDALPAGITYTSLV